MRFKATKTVPAGSSWERRILWLASVAICVALPLTGPANGQSDAAPSPLDEVIKALQTNADQLETWQGRAVIRETSQRAGDLPEGIEPRTDRQTTTTFVLDRTRAALRTEQAFSKSFRIINREGVEQAQGEGELVVAQMLRDGALYELETAPEELRGDSDVRRIDITQNSPSKRELGRTGPVFHPAERFLSPRGVALTTLLSDMRDRNGEGAYEVDLSSDGTKVSLVLQSGSTTNRYVFDLAMSGNLVTYSNTTERSNGPDRYTRMEFEYEERGGVHVPARYTLERQGVSGSGIIVTDSEEVAFIEQRVNEPVPDDAFTLKAMGAEPGDRVIDNRNGATFRYGEADPEGALDDPAFNVSAKSVSAEPPQPPSAVRTSDEGHEGARAASNRGASVAQAAIIAAVALGAGGVGAAGWWFRTRKGVHRTKALRDGRAR